MLPTLKRSEVPDGNWNIRFFFSQILREINLLDFRTPKLIILTILQALKIGFCDFQCCQLYKRHILKISVAHILREINFSDFETSKTNISAILQAFRFGF